MKHISKDKKFQKHFNKHILPNQKLVNQFDDRVRDFARGKRDNPLNDHSLAGDKIGLQAFSISGDIRVVYKETEDTYIFLDIGSHNQVY